MADFYFLETQKGAPGRSIIHFLFFENLLEVFK